MKKLTAMFMVLAMCLAFCGCAATNTTYDVIGFMQTDEGTSAPLGISHAIIGVDADEMPAIVDFNLSRTNGDPVKGTTVFSEEGIGIQIPDVDESYYLVKWEATGFDPSDFSTEKAEEIIESVDTDVLLAKGEKYADVFGILFEADGMSVSEKKSAVLPGLEAEVENLAVTEFSPSEENWRVFLETLIDTISNDEEIWNYVRTAAIEGYPALEDDSAYASAEEYAEDQVKTAKDTIAALGEDVELYAKALDGSKITTVKSEDRVHMATMYISFLDMVAGYESADVDGTRKDGIFLYGEEPECLFLNKYINDERGWADVLEIGSTVLPGGGYIHMSHVPDENAVFGIDRGFIEVHTGDFGSANLSIETTLNGTALTLTGNMEGTSVLVTAITTGEPYASEVPEGEQIVINTEEELDELVEMFSEALNTAEEAE